MLQYAIFSCVVDDNILIVSKFSEKKTYLVEKAVARSLTNKSLGLLLLYKAEIIF